MLSFEEHPGVLSFLLGIIVLVMAAVGLSLLADKRLDASSGIMKIQREIELDASKIEELTTLHGERSRSLAGSVAQPGAESIDEISKVLETLGERKVVLEGHLRRLRTAVATLNDEFSQCRAERRRKTWVAAIGERLGDLAVSGGREYKQATIARVTDVGLEIRHQDGVARIHFPDLDVAMQERFEWNDEQRRRVLNEVEGFPTKEIDGVPGGEEVVGTNPGSPAPNTNRLRQKPSMVDRDEVIRLRRLVSGWQNKVSQLRRDKDEAETRSSYENQASIPGSLETWNAKVIRLGSELARAQVELAIAKARLSSVSVGE